MPGVCTFAFFISRTIATSTARPRQSSPMPGRCSDRAFALHLDVGAFGKHRVEMRGDDEMRMRRRARIVAEHVADLVDAHVLQAELLNTRCSSRPRTSSLNDGRGNLAEADLIRDRLRLARLRGVERRLHRRILQQIGRRRRAALRLSRTDRQRQRQPAANTDRSTSTSVNQNSSREPRTA